MRNRFVFASGVGVSIFAAAAFIVTFNSTFDNANAQSAGGPAGCYGGADACRSLATTSPRVTPAPPQNDGFAGLWTGRGDGAEAVVQIRQASQTGYTVHHEIDSKRGCTGSVQGAATASGNRLVLRIPIDNENLCVMTYSRNANRLSVHEEGCLSFHPATCAFDGTVTRKGNMSAASPRLVVPQPASWLIGAWVPQGASCASEDTVVFNSDGSYTSGYMVNGIWRLLDNQLQVTYTESGPDEPPGPKIHKTPSIAKINADEMKLGSTRMRRCPAHGGIEPWHPKKRFTVN